MKNSFIAIVIMIITVIFPIAGLAKTNSGNTQVIIKLNQYSVLYTYPKQPYINNDNRLMVPINFVEDLIGMDVEYNGNTLRISMSNNTVKLSVNSTVAVVNGKSVEMDSMTILDKNTQTILIPIRIIIDSFNFNAEWNSQWKHLEINDERILKTELVNKIIIGSDVWGNNEKIDNDCAFRVNSFFLKTIKQEENCDYIQLSIEAENITGDYIHEGKEDIHHWILFRSHFIAETDTRTTRERSAVNEGEIIKRDIFFYLDKMEEDDYIRYIIIWPRTVNLST